jgi:hypothetical protein
MRVDPALTPFLAVAAASLKAPRAPVVIRDVREIQDLLSQYPASPFELRPGLRGAPLTIRPPRRAGEPLVGEMDPDLLAFVCGLSDADLDAAIRRHSLEEGASQVPRG